jgi:hypothetical protein
MPTKSYHRAVAAATLEELQIQLGQEDAFPCVRQKEGKPCTRIYEDARDNDTGRPVFYFETGCRVVEEFCPACQAYWHVAVARNCLITLDRISPEENERHESQE